MSPRLSAAAIAAEVQAGTRSAEAVAAEALARIVAYDAVQPQAWIERPRPEAVLAAARAVDARIAAGEILPLAGVPYAVKDNIDVAGLPTTAACPAFAYQPARSATVVERLQAAGAVMMGKTNLDQFATGLVGTRSPYGAPGCVFNRDYVSGGSSSGSAVATGAGLVAFALGTDTAGSGRVPAAFNGLIGFKPTKGRWSTRGIVPACRSIDCVTVFTDKASDAALVDSVLSTFDGEDSYSRRAPAEGPDLGAAFTFGAPRPDQRQFLGDEASAAFYDAAIARVSAMGGTAVEVDIQPLLDAAQLLYSGPWVAERTAAVEDLLRTKPAAIQLTSREARLVARTRSAAAYRLYAMAETTPPKPALVHVGDGGASIELEVYELPVEAFGSFVVEVPAPLAIGMVTLEDGSTVKGFVAEPRALDGAEDITALGGWRAYIASK